MNKTLSIAAILSATLTLQACWVTTPRFPQEAMQAEMTALGAPSEWAFGSEMDAPIAAGWGEIINDPALLALIHEALAGNPNLRASAENVRRAEALLLQSKSNRLPQVSARAGATESSFLDDIDFSERFNASVDASWEADLWGSIRSGILASQYDLAGAEAIYKSAREALVANVARAYFTAVETGGQVALAEQTLNAQLETQRIVTVRFDLGAASKREAVLADSDVAGARDALEQARANQRAAIRALEVLLGRYPDGTLNVSTAFPRVVADIGAGTPADILRRRPDVLAAEYDIGTAFASLNATRANRWPRLSLTGGVSSVTDSLGDLLDPADLALSLGAGLANSLFDGGLTRGRIENAEASERQALARYGNAVLDAYADVEDALDTIETLDARAVFVRERAEAARETLRLAEVQYKEGAIDLLDVLTFRQRSFSADRALLTLERQRLDARVALYLALGGSSTSSDAPE